MFMSITFFGGPRVFIRTATETIPNNYSNVELSIGHIYGSASISMAPKDADYVLLIEVDAFRKLGTKISQVETGEISEINIETVSVLFDDSHFAAADPGPGWNNIRFFIRENINLSLNILRGCADGFNITLHNLIISNLTINYEWSRIEHIASFKNVIFNFSTPIILRSKSSSLFEFHENIYTSNLTLWDIQLDSPLFQSTLELKQTIPLTSSPSFYQFHINCQWQTIYVKLHLDPTFGINITTNTESGFVHLPNNMNYYTSPNYNLSEVKYDFLVTSDTGNITFNIFDS